MIPGGDGRGAILGLFDRPLYRDWLAWVTGFALVAIAAWALTNQGDEAVGTNITGGLYIFLLAAVVGVRFAEREVGSRLKSWRPSVSLGAGCVSSASCPPQERARGVTAWSLRRK